MKVRADTDRCSYSRKPGFTETRLRPLARRLEITARPLLVFMRVRNPCVLERRRRLGWNVRFGMRNCAPHWENSHRDKLKVYRLSLLASKRTTTMREALRVEVCFDLQFCRAPGAEIVSTQMCTANATEKNFFASNIHEINHSQLACRNRSAITILCCGFFVLGCHAATEKTFQSHSLMECCFSPWPLRLRILHIS